MKFIKTKKNTQRAQKPFMGKKGEMTTEQIVILIIAIASFAVILYFLATLSLGSNTEDELCHNSVAQRATAGSLPGVSADTVPLKCKKSYVCITKDGSCENSYKPETIKVKNKKEVYSALADELANCWWMFGEGKVNFAESDLTQNLYCSFCSQIAFDDSVKEIFPKGEFSENDLYLELTKLNKTKDETYFKYLFGTSDSTEFLKQNFGNIKLDKQYYSLIGITGDVSTLKWAASGAVLLAAMVLTGGIFGAVTVTAAGVAGAAGAGGALGLGAGALAYSFTDKTVATTIKGKSGNDFIPPTLIQVNSEELKALNCDEVNTAS